MSANATTQNARDFPGVFLFLLMLIALSLFTMIIRFQTNHGKRNNEPDLAERCLNRHGVAHTLVEKASGRIHLICTESETEFYDVIYQDQGTLDGSTPFRVQSYTDRWTKYTSNTIDEYINFLIGRGHTVLDASQFTGPFTFVWP